MTAISASCCRSCGSRSPGVQVLFAFLLAVPFQQNFTEITTFQENAYFGTLLSTTISAALLIAPSAYHRITFGCSARSDLVCLANRLAIAGLAFLALAMTGAVTLITDVLFGALTTLVVATAAATLFVLLWYVLPTRQGRQLSE